MHLESAIELISEGSKPNQEPPKSDKDSEVKIPEFSAQYIREERENQFKDNENLLDGKKWQFDDSHL